MIRWQMNSIFPINTYVAEHISYHLQTISNTSVVIGLHCNECYDFEGYISFLVALVSLECYLRLTFRIVIQFLKQNTFKFQESKLHWLEVEALAFRRMMILLSEKNQLVMVRVHFHFANIHSDVSTLIILLGSSVYASSRTRKLSSSIYNHKQLKVNFLGLSSHHYFLFCF